MSEHTIGVDISKSHLDAFRLEDSAAQRFDNSAAGFRALTKWLNTTPVARIVFEPTGPYQKAFGRAVQGDARALSTHLRHSVPRLSALRARAR